MARHETRQDVAQDIREIVGNRIRLAQAAKGLTTEELAREVGISLRLVQKHRAGDNAPGFDNLAKYGRALDKPIGWFFGEAEVAA